VRCEVAAASKAVRPGGDRVKTDTRDALLLARLRLDEVVPVQVPTEEQESARDLVRCREATRADLMRSVTGCPSRCCATASCTAAGAPIMSRHTARWARSSTSSRGSVTTDAPLTATVKRT